MMIDEVESLEGRSDALQGVDKLLSLCSTATRRRVMLGVCSPLGLMIDVTKELDFIAGIVTIRDECRAVS